LTEQKGIPIPLSSGFTVLVKPLPPYYLDFIEEQIPLLKYPSRKLKLLGGDTIEVEYILPESMPSADNSEDYELYINYKATELKNKELEQERYRAKTDFLLSNCVVIQEDGPIDYKSDDWVTKLEASFENYKVPTHPGKRMLAFLKSNVILKPEERDIIVSTSCYQEVNLQGIIDALLGFRDQMGQQTTA